MFPYLYFGLRQNFGISALFVLDFSFSINFFCLAFVAFSSLFFFLYICFIAPSTNVLANAIEHKMIIISTWNWNIFFIQKTWTWIWVYLHRKFLMQVRYLRHSNWNKNDTHRTCTGVWLHARVCVGVNWNKNNPKTYAFAIYWFFVIGPIAIESAILFCHSLYGFFVLFCSHWMCEHILVMIIMLLRMHMCVWVKNRTNSDPVIAIVSYDISYNMFELLFWPSDADKGRHNQLPLFNQKAWCVSAVCTDDQPLLSYRPRFFSFDFVFYLVRRVCLPVGLSVCLSVGHIFSIPL